jgi:flagellar assembly protein FliH
MMNSSAKRRPVITSAGDAGDVIIAAGAVRRSVPSLGVVSSAADFIAEAERRAAEIVTAAEVQAAGILDSANREAGGVREAAYQEGLIAGDANVKIEFEQYMELARAAAREGKAIHDDVVAESSLTIVRAVSLAVQRLVAEHYADNPEKTVAVCAEALRAAVSQTVIRIRVNETAMPAVRTSLSRDDIPVAVDNSITIGGCVVDLEQGTIDATLESRLQLLENSLSDEAAAA